MIVSVERWQIEFDPQQTSLCYEVLPVGSGCNCHSCTNFMAAIDLAFPPEFRSFLEQFGIDVRKPIELTHFCREESGDHLMGGWFHLVGAIKGGADAWKQVGETTWVPDFVKFAEKIEFGFSSRVAILHQAFNGQEVIQLEFHTRIPWVIEEEEWS